MDELDWGPGLPAAPGDARRFQRWSKAAGDAIVERTAAGESLRAICRDPELPNVRVVHRWMGTRPAFARAVRDARARAGRSFIGRPPAYCQATAEIIFERLCQGEGIVAICRDPDMPAASTVYRWLAQDLTFRDAIALAREIAAEAVFERGFEICEAATPETAYLAHVRLTHLRWGAAKLAPRKYGALKAQEATDAETDKVDSITVCRFERGPNNEVLRIPPINAEDEARWISAYGKPYDGPRVQVVRRD
jgi:hypothetical protein